MGNIEMIWVDLETTGLNSRVDHILEIAIVGTDKYGDDPQVLFNEVVLPPRTDQMDLMTMNWPSIRDAMEEVVYDMHAKSGLLAEIDALYNEQARPRFRARQVEGRALATIEAAVGINGLPMCGSTIHFDRGFIAEHMPKLNMWFHYRNIDISTLKNVCRLVNEPVASRTPEKGKAHRALPDIMESIEEYKFYLDNFVWLG